MDGKKQSEMIDILNNIETSLIDKITSSTETAEGIAGCTNALLKLWVEYPVLLLKYGD